MISLFEVRGIVEKGKQRGRLLGFPTANILVDKGIPEGIYVSEVILNGINYKAATFVGVAKTFNEKDYLLESYILDFNKDVYGEEMFIKLYKKIRDNKKFDSEEDLINQMKNDINITRKFFNQP